MSSAYSVKCPDIFSVSQCGICIPHCEIYIPHCGFCISQCETENLFPYFLLYLRMCGRIITMISFLQGADVVQLSV